MERAPPRSAEASAPNWGASIAGGAGETRAGWGGGGDIAARTGGGATGLGEGGGEAGARSTGGGTEAITVVTAGGRDGGGGGEEACSAPPLTSVGSSSMVGAGLGAVIDACMGAGDASAAPMLRTILVSPRTMVSPSCSVALLTFWPFTNVPLEPRSMIETSPLGVVSITACMRLTASSSMRRCDDDSLPIL